MPSTDDLSTYTSLFLDEAAEQLTVIENGIIVLESSPSQESLSEIFRAAHSLKGAARAMGFGGVGDLTHVMEDVFAQLRSGQLVANSVLTDTLLSALDVLKQSMHEIAANGSATADPTNVTARLRSHLNSTGGTTDTQSQAKRPGAGSGSLRFQHGSPGPAAELAIHDALESDLRVYAVAVHIARDCCMRSVRAHLVLQAMEQLGSVLSTTPAEEAIENEAFDFTFGFLLATDREIEEVDAAARSVGEVERAEVAIWSPPEESQERDCEQTEIASAPQERRQGTQTATVRVDVARLDTILNLVGELVIDQTRLSEIASRLRVEDRADEQTAHLGETTAHLARITSDMQNEIMRARMLPLENLFARFPRMVRDLAQRLGKEIDFTVSGSETELDRSVIEVIGDPLIHLLRNCVDHGIEPASARVSAGKPERGSIWLRARHEENQIRIEIGDDGAGIDPMKVRTKAVSMGVLTQDAASRLTDEESVQLIFAAGVTTADRVTDISGRGVGMDVVRNNLTRFGASVGVESRIGQGTRFTIRLPLTLAIIRGLLVSAAGGIYVIPLSTVIEACASDHKQIHRVGHRDVMLWRGSTVPLVRLGDALGVDPDRQAGIALNVGDFQTDHIVVVSASGGRAGILVDAVVGEQEIVIKSLSKLVGEPKGISGVTILGDGRIALILDVDGLLSVATERKVRKYVA